MLFQLVRFLSCLALVAFLFNLPLQTNAQETSAKGSQIALAGVIPTDLMLKIVRAEDERRWDADLSSLLSHADPSVRSRAALAAGRIGDERSVPALTSLLREDKDDRVRSMAAFALGETESANAGDALMLELANRESPLKARIVEAVGKIAAALPASDEERLKSLRGAILSALEFEAARRSAPNTEIILFGFTAALRARPEGAGKVIAQFLSNGDPRIRADAANALARLRAGDGNEQLRKILTGDSDPIVRANAARVLGATEDKTAFDGLLDRALKDSDARVRVSAIRGLASLRDPRATAPLLNRAAELKLKQETNEVLELATALGRTGQNTKSEASINWLRQLQVLGAPEVEVALARIAPQLYSIALQPSGNTWRHFAAIGQGAAELANVKSGNPVLDASIKTTTIRNITERLNCVQAKSSDSTPKVKRGMVVGTRCTPLPTLAVSDWLRAFAAFKTPDSAETLRKFLLEKDVITRATAAELLGELPPDETNTQALISALPVALKDKQLNDAALAVLDALGKQKSTAANEAIKSALDSQDHLVRRRAVALLKTNGAGDLSARIGTVQTGNTRAHYERAISRIRTTVHATVSTSRGAFKIELLPADASLTVDNFVQLSRKGYFRGIAVHRVVPNFVIQDGDPRGDGNGGPGYSIRCEINQVPYDRGAVGMALSGKDTGGSQWFVTHSPQPHLDGGYTVFGKVMSGMDVVDRITRGDVIRSIVITELAGARSKR